MPHLPSSTQLSISEGGRSNCRLASDTVVLPWMISRTSADLRWAVQRLISLFHHYAHQCFPFKLAPEQEITGSYIQAQRRQTRSGTKAAATTRTTQPPA